MLRFALHGRPGANATINAHRCVVAKALKALKNEQGTVGFLRLLSQWGWLLTVLKRACLVTLGLIPVLQRTGKKKSISKIWHLLTEALSIQDARPDL